MSRKLSAKQQKAMAQGRARAAREREKAKKAQRTLVTKVEKKIQKPRRRAVKAQVATAQWPSSPWTWNSVRYGNLDTMIVAITHFYAPGYSCLPAIALWVTMFGSPTNSAPPANTSQENDLGASPDQENSAEPNDG